MLHLVSALLIAGSLGTQETRSRDANVYLTDKEVALGTGLANEFRQRSIPLESTAAQQYVERLGHQLAPYFPDQPPFTYKFSIVADAGEKTGLHEPCVFPGGFVFVPASLFSSARDEAEFAGVLAHAMAHVAARHGTRMARSGQSAGSGNIPLVFMGGRYGVCSGCGNASVLLVPVGFINAARTDELDADQLAVKAMVRAGYDPAALVRYIGREQIETEGKASTSSLPRREDRLAALNAAIAMLPPGTYSEGPQFVPVRQEVLAVASRLRRVPARKEPSLRH